MSASVSVSRPRPPPPRHQRSPPTTERFFGPQRFTSLPLRRQTSVLKPPSAFGPPPLRRVVKSSYKLMPVPVLAPKSAQRDGGLRSPKSRLSARHHKRAEHRSREWPDELGRGFWSRGLTHNCGRVVALRLPYKGSRRGGGESDARHRLGRPQVVGGGARTESRVDGRSGAL